MEITNEMIVQDQLRINETNDTQELLRLIAEFADKIGDLSRNKKGIFKIFYFIGIAAKIYLYSQMQKQAYEKILTLSQLTLSNK